MQPKTLKRATFFTGISSNRISWLRPVPACHGFDSLTLGWAVSSTKGPHTISSLVSNQVSDLFFFFFTCFVSLHFPTSAPHMNVFQAPLTTCLPNVCRAATSLVPPRCGRLGWSCLKHCRERDLRPKDSSRKSVPSERTYLRVWNVQPHAKLSVCPFVLILIMTFGFHRLPEISETLFIKKTRGPPYPGPAAASSVASVI